MEVKEIVEKTVNKVKNDKDLQEQFKKDPVKAVEKITGIDLPDDLVEKVIPAIKAKLAGGGIIDGIKNLL
ncbi:MAG: hypothetical protein K5686_10730 [Lachnospiraceae bacterium]|nr:hypothetical protein [Lachnospiraceae bacterium]